MNPRISSYVAQAQLLSDQIDKAELAVILNELQRVLERGTGGDVVELGCYTGTTSVHLAHFLETTKKTLYLYDSFEGLPAKTTKDESPAGLQFVTGELLASRKQLLTNLRNARVRKPTITKGWFKDLTLKDMPDQISFAFLDGDYYESVRDSLRVVWPHLALGATIVVDDYMNEALPGAARAVDEWLTTHPARLQANQSLAVIHT